LKKKIPKYYIFRILLVAIFFQISLILPPLLFSILNIGPAQNGLLSTNYFNEFNINFQKIGIGIIYISGLIIYIAYNLPFRIFLRRLKKGKNTADWIKKFTKKNIQYTAIVNSGIYLLTGLIITILRINELRDLKEISNAFYIASKQINYITLIVTILISMMIFIWQLTRVRIYYLDYFYPEDDLKTTKNIVHKTSLRMNLLLSNVITTFLPIIIILFYIFLNINQVNDIVKIESMTEQQAQIYFGKYYDVYQKIISNPQYSADTKNKVKQFIDKAFGRYYNSFSTTFMITGVFMSILSIFFYIVFITKLNAKLIVVPIRDLMYNVKKTAKGEFGSYTIVRAKNEVGVLTESYNIMSEQLKKYFDELKDLNKNLEQKVIERTAFIEKQKEEIESQRDEVIKQRNFIKEQNIQITDSIQYAKNIQKSIIPSISKIDSILESYFLIFIPKDILSGDFYWIKQKSEETIIIGADCTGHGVPGAMMSILGISSINEIINSGNYKNTADILNQLRTKIIEALKTEGKEQSAQDGMDLSLIILNKDKKTLQFSGANNSLFITSKHQITTKEDIIRISQKENKEAKLYEIRADRMPVGSYVKEDTPFSYHNIKLNKGDRIYIYSDGFPDLFNFSKHQKYSKKRFKDLLLSTYLLPIEQQKEEIMKEYKNWLDDYQIDDILIWGIAI